MRKIFASEFMTIDGVIQNEEADGDGFKYGGWFSPYADEVTGAVVQERLTHFFYQRRSTRLVEQAGIAENLDFREKPS